MTSPDPWPNEYMEGPSHSDQEEIRLALLRWCATFPNTFVAASVLGITPACLAQYRTGRRRIPNWISESLGFRHRYYRTAPKPGFEIPGEDYRTDEMVYLAGEKNL